MPVAPAKGDITMGKSAPPPPDYKGAAEASAASSAANTAAQTQANRPDQSNAYGSTLSWHQGPDGRWTQSQQFGGPFAGLNQNLEQQALFSMGGQMDPKLFGPVMGGDAARDQAINSAYGQATSRLNPQWDQRGSQLQTQLMNQGLDPGSEAYQNAMGQFSRDRNDAYSSAMNGAIGQGTEAGQAVFNQNMASHQQSLADALRQRTQPMQDLQSLQGFLGQQGFSNAGAASATDYLGAAAAQGNYQMEQHQSDQQADADRWAAVMKLLQTGATFAASDERVKNDIVRMTVDALPGVPFASWEYKGVPGKRFSGVIAQDLEKVAPQYVVTRSDGIKFVDYSFLLEHPRHV
jgi:hypothetical protein